MAYVRTRNEDTVKEEKRKGTIEIPAEYQGKYFLSAADVKKYWELAGNRYMNF